MCAFHGLSGGRFLFWLLCCVCVFCSVVFVVFLVCVVLCDVCLGLSWSLYLYCVCTCLLPGPAGNVPNLPSIGLYGSLCIGVHVVVFM